MFKSLASLLCVAVLFGCSARTSSEIDSRPARKARVEKEVFPPLPPVVLSAGDLLLYVDNTDNTEFEVGIRSSLGESVDFYEHTTDSIAQCKLPYNTQLSYVGSHGVHAVATVVDEYKSANPHKAWDACAKGTPVVLLHSTALSWKKDQEIRDAAKRETEAKRNAVLTAARAVLKKS